MRRLSVAVLVVAAALAVGVPASVAAGGATDATDGSAADPLVVSTDLTPVHPTPEENATLTVRVDNTDDQDRYRLTSVSVYDSSAREEKRASAFESTIIDSESSVARDLSVGFDEVGEQSLHVVIRMETSGGEPFAVTRTVTTDVRDPHPAVSLSSEPVGPNDRTSLEFTVANGLDEPVTGLELDLSAADATLDEPRHVVSKLAAGGSETLTVRARGVSPGEQAVTADLSYTTADGERRTATRRVTTTVERRDARLSMGLSAEPVGPSNRTTFDVTVANGFTEPVSALELQVESPDATLIERRRVASNLSANAATTFSLPAKDVTAGERTVVATVTYTTAAGERLTVTRELSATVDELRRPGKVSLTGLRVDQTGDRLVVRGSASNVGATNVSSVVVEAVDGEDVRPADTQRRYFVGAVPESDFSSFEVQAVPTGDANGSVTVPLRVSYVVDETEVSRTVRLDYEPSATPDGNPQESSFPLVLVGGLLVVGAAALGGWRWYDGRD
jgi:hypothetical protein